MSFLFPVSLHSCISLCLSLKVGVDMCWAWALVHFTLNIPHNSFNLSFKYLTVLIVNYMLIKLEKVQFFIAMSNCGFSWWPSGEEGACSCRRCRFNPWVGRIPWRRKWQPNAVFLPGKFHGSRRLAGSVHGVSKSQTWLSNWARMHVTTHTHQNVSLTTAKPSEIS